MNQFPKKKFHELISAHGVFSDGDWVESKDQDPEGDVRLIQLADIGVGEYLNKSSRFMTKEKAAELKCTYLKEGDILIARMPDPIGRACLFPGDKKKCVTVVDVCIVRPASNKIDSKWLMYLINSNAFSHKILQYVTGTTRQRISRKNLSEIVVEVPSLETQKHIARVLEQADQLRKQAHQMESELNQLAQSLFLEMFGDPAKAAEKWKTLSLKSISNKFNDGPFGSNLKSEHYVKNGVRVIRLQNIASGSFVDKDRAFVSEAHAESLKKFWCKAGDIVIATLGDPNLRACIIPEQIPFAINKADCVHCVPNPDVIESEWLMSYLNLPQTLGMISQDLHGQTRTRISSGQLAKLQVPIPSLKEQKLFTDRVAHIDELKATCEQQKIKIEESFGSLMQRAFKGELTTPGSKAA